MLQNCAQDNGTQVTLGSVPDLALGIWKARLSLGDIFTIFQRLTLTGRWIVALHLITEKCLRETSVPCCPSIIPRHNRESREFSEESNCESGQDSWFQVDRKST